MYENLLANVPTDLYIGGKWRKSSDNQRFDVIDPATEKKVASVASATPDDAIAAVDAAHAALEGWAGKKPRERGEIPARSRGLVTNRFSRCDDRTERSPSPHQASDVRRGFERCRACNRSPLPPQLRSSDPPAPGFRDRV